MPDILSEREVREAIDAQRAKENANVTLAEAFKRIEALEQERANHDADIAGLNKWVSELEAEVKALKAWRGTSSVTSSGDAVMDAHYKIDDLREQVVKMAEDMQSVMFPSMMRNRYKQWLDAQSEVSDGQEDTQPVVDGDVDNGIDSPAHKSNALEVSDEPQDSKDVDDTGQSEDQEVFPSDTVLAERLKSQSAQLEKEVSDEPQDKPSFEDGRGQAQEVDKRMELDMDTVCDNGSGDISDTLTNLREKMMAVLSGPMLTGHRVTDKHIDAIIALIESIEQHNKEMQGYCNWIKGELDKERERAEKAEDDARVATKGYHRQREDWTKEKKRVAGLEGQIETKHGRCHICGQHKYCGHLGYEDQYDENGAGGQVEYAYCDLCHFKQQIDFQAINAALLCLDGYRHVITDVDIDRITDRIEGLRKVYQTLAGRDEDESSV
jgi:hypothetical protein